MSEITEKWSDIDWIVVNNNVKKLRQRIFNASLPKDVRNLRFLQKLMLKSKSNIFASLRNVSNNTGGKTRGIDGEVLSITILPFEREISKLLNVK
jgi:RNA-directed DNA polymerase